MMIGLWNMVNINSIFMIFIKLNLYVIFNILGIRVREGSGGGEFYSLLVYLYC